MVVCFEKKLLVLRPPVICDDNLKKCEKFNEYFSGICNMNTTDIDAKFNEKTFNPGFELNNILITDELIVEILHHL